MVNQPAGFAWFFLGSLALVGSTSCDRAVPLASAQTGSQPAPVVVNVAQVRSGPLSRPIRATGIVQPKQTTDLGFKVGGVIASVEVDEGAIVKKGQVLARIDATEVGASVAQAKESLSKAERDAARTRTLHDGRVVTQSDLDNAQTGVALAKSASVAAHFNLRHTVIVAPADGWIDERHAEPGEIAAPGRPVLRFSSRGQGWIARVALADRDALALAAGAPAEITLDAAADHQLSGSVSSIATAADPRTGTFAVEVAIAPGEGPPLRAGLTAKVRFAREVAAPFVVPIAALSSGDGDRAVVYAADGGVARRVPVKVAFLTGESAAISSGLEGVGAVIVSGSSDLRDGSAIEVSASPEPAR